MNVERNEGDISCGCTMGVGSEQVFTITMVGDHAAHTGITHLWQHLILPSPAQSYSQQVVHHRGRLQADDTIIVVFRNPAQDSITVSLKHTEKDVEVALSKLRIKRCRRLWVFSKECWILTMDSLMSSNSKASSVFSWGQNRLRESDAQKRWSWSRRREKGKMEKKGIGEDGGRKCWKSTLATVWFWLFSTVFPL